MHHFSNFNKKTINSCLFIVLLVVTVIYLISSFYPTFKTDDDVSMGLITHTYSNLINIDATDVHPPLYYLFLKFFLQVTTFWTNSMIIKTLVARLFSAFCLFIAIIFLSLIAKEMKLNINYKWQIFIYLLVPCMINKLVKIRMYSISILFLSIELYELIKFYKTNKNLDIILSTFSAILASYCLYPSAVSAGLFLFSMFITALIFHNKRRAIKLLISGISLIIFYIPWIPIAVSQFSIHSNKDVDNNLVNIGYVKAFLQSFTQLIFPPNLPTIPVIIISLMLFIISIYDVIFSFTHFNRTFKIMFSNIIFDFIGTVLIIWIISGVNYQPGVIYPSFAIFSFIIINILVYILLHLNNVNSILSIMACLIFALYGVGGTYSNVKQFDIPSIKLIKNYKLWKNAGSNIIVKTHNPLEALQDSIYIKSLDKDIIIKGVSKKQLSTNAFDDYNYRPVKKLFNNMKMSK